MSQKVMTVLVKAIHRVCASVGHYLNYCPNGECWKHDEPSFVGLIVPLALTIRRTVATFRADASDGNIGDAVSHCTQSPFHC